MNIRGTSLLEVLLAVLLVGITAIVIAVLFPRVSSTITNNRLRAIAGHLATARIQELLENSYQNLPLTPPGTAGDYFPSIVAAAGGCDCNQVNWANLLAAQGPDSVNTQDGVAYTRQLCITLVNRTGGVWNSYCSDNTSNTDFGLKNVHVHVSWSYGGTPYNADAESLVTR